MLLGLYLRLCLCLCLCLRLCLDNFPCKNFRLIDAAICGLVIQSLAV
jgi:hypothetical protein